MLKIRRTVVHQIVFLFKIILFLFNSKMIVIIGLAFFTLTTTALPQQQNPNIQSQIDSVFGPAPTGNGNAQSSRPNGRGFATIVTPDPLDNYEPTSSPQTALTDTGDRCTCVPYYLCDPSNNMVRNDNSDGEVDGFGLIDIRLGAETCEHYLDVCCKSDNQKEEPIVPKPVTTKPNRKAGCGIRNVGGLDFQLAGASVCV